LSVTQTTEDLRERWKDRFDTNEDWGILGISFGGMIATDWCARYPQDFKKLVVLNSTDRGSARFYQRLNFKVWKDFVNVALSKNSQEREKKILKLSANRKFERLPYSP